MTRALALAVALALLAAAPAGATFPGRNGNLLVTHDDGQAKYFVQHFTLWKIAPRTGRVRQTPICGAAIADVTMRCIGAGPPAASPDGKTVAVAARDRPANSDRELRWSVRLISVETGTQTRIPLSPSAYPLLPVLDPVVRWRQGGDGFLVLRALAPWVENDPRAFKWQPARASLVPPDGSGETELLAPADAPDVASDGRLAFVRYRNVHIRDQFGAVRRLTTGGGFHPSWSPGGRFVAFSRFGRVFVVPSAGGEPRRLTRGTDPVWSPDGTQIAFFREVEARGAERVPVTYLYVLSRRTGRVRRVSEEAIDYDDDYGGGAGAGAGLDWQALPPAP